MSTEKLSELSKPVAWVLGTPSCKHLTADAEYADWYLEHGSTAAPLYSQEYVSALLADRDAWQASALALRDELREVRAELEAKTDFSDKAIERISGLEKACDKYLRQTKKAERELLAAKEHLAELEAKLATPVRLPDTRQSISGERYQWSDGIFNYKQDAIAMLRAAGFTVGDE